MRESLRRLASDDGMAARMNAGRVRVELLTGDHITVDVEVTVVGRRSDVFKYKFFIYLLVPGRVFPYSGAGVHKLAETAAVTLLPYS